MAAVPALVIAEAPWRGHTNIETVGPVALGPAAGQFEPILDDPAKVAAAIAGQPAVVGPGGVVITVAITNSEIKNLQPQQGHRRSNCALKFIREFIGEAFEQGQPCVAAVEVTHTRHVFIPVYTKLDKKRLGVRGRRHGLGLELCSL